jgi:hypothetical protein
MMRFDRGLRLLLLCVVLAFTRGGSGIVQAQSGVDPLVDRLMPVSHLGGSATAFRLLEDDYACLAIGDDFLVLDILDPFHPVQVGVLSFTGMVIDIHIVGSYAYVLADGRIQVVDLTNPYQPRKLSLLPPLTVVDIDVEGDYLYVAGQAVFIYSLANPTAPVWISTYPSEYNLSVVAAFPYLFIQAQAPFCTPLFCGGYQIIHPMLDISHPENPVLLSYAFSVSALAESQEFFFVLPRYDPQIRVVARADMGTQTTSATIPLPAPGSGLYVQGNTLFVAGGEAGLRIFDITDPLAAVAQGSVNSLLDARDVIVKDRAAFVVGGSQGLVAVNVRHPASPFPYGGYRTVGSAQHVTLSGSYLYASSDRLDVVDISNPADPLPVGEYNRRGFPMVAGEVLYLAAGGDGLAAVDIRNPAAPFELDLLDLPDGAAAVAIDGDYAYVASAGGQLHVVNITDPQALTLANSVSAQPATDIAISDGSVYLAGGSQVSFFDLTLPGSPQLDFQHTIYIEGQGGCGGDGTIGGIAVEGNRVYVSWNFYLAIVKVCEYGAAGILIIEKDPIAGWQLIEDSLAEPGIDIEISGGIGYLLSGTSRHDYSPQNPLVNMMLRVFDAAHPSYSEKLSFYAFTGNAADLAIQGELVVVGKTEEGIHILQWADPQLYFPIIHTP